MARNFTIAISAQDNVSDALKKMTDATMHFNKNVEEMQTQLAGLNRNRATVHVDVRTAKENLEAMRKAYKAAKQASGDGVVDEKMIEELQKANEEYERANNNLKLLDTAARKTSNALTSTSAAMSKAGAKAGAKDGLLGALATAGMIKMGGDLVGGVAQTYVGSRFGSETATIFSSGVSGGASGASMGMMAGGVPGAVVGAVAGGAIGLASGGLQVKQQQDDSFKSVRQDQYNTISQKREADLTEGIALAAQREMDDIAFTKLLGGKETANDHLGWIKKTANETPFLYEDLKGLSKTLAVYGYSPEEAQTKIMQIGDTGASYGMSAADMAMVATGLGRMRSTDKANLEYMNLLTERGIDGQGYLAKSMGVSKAEVYDMITKGQISGKEAAEIIADSMGAENVGAMEEMSKTYSGLTSTQKGYDQERRATMGIGFTEKNKRQVELNNAFFDPESETGKEMNEMYRSMGEYQATLTNKRMESERLALVALFESEEYQNAKAIGDTATTGRLATEAALKAEVAYRSSEEYQLYEQTEKKTVENLGVALKDDWENFGYEMGLAFSKGLAESTALGIEAKYKELGEKFNRGQLSFEEYKTNISPNASEWDYQTYVRDKTEGKSHAAGLARVPYDEYPARLHEGERVLTAAEARTYTKTIHEPWSALQPQSESRAQRGIAFAAPADGFGIATVTRFYRTTENNSTDKKVIENNWVGNAVGGSTLQSTRNPFSAEGMAAPTAVPDTPRGFAYGLARVPYDEYPARLHEGERVLTASEAREYNSGRAVVVNITGGMTVREEADIDRIAEEIARRVREVQRVT